VIRELEYLDEAIEEAEAAARWYAERSNFAATGFADEIDSAIAAIEQNPEAWPSIASRKPGFSSWPSPTDIDDRSTGSRGYRIGLANTEMAPRSRA